MHTFGSNRPLDHQLLATSFLQRLAISFHDASTSTHLVLVVGCPNVTGYGFAVIYVNSSIEKVGTVGVFFFTVPTVIFWEYSTPGRAFEVLNKSGVEREKLE